MTAMPRTDWISPSLAAVPEGVIPAFEMKFLVAQSTLPDLEAWVSEHFSLDPHADPTRENCYQVNTVYFDTPQFDVLRRSPSYRRDKYRIRRYGTDSLTHLERKSKQNGRVWKVRHTLPVSQLTAGVFAGEKTPNWFSKEVTDLRLQPVCRLSYLRKAFFGPSPAGSLRITVDRNAMGAQAEQSLPHPVESGLLLLQDEAIVEFKYLAHMPAILKEAIEIFRLCPTRISKYRRWGKFAGLHTIEQGEN